MPLPTQNAPVAQCIYLIEQQGRHRVWELNLLKFLCPLLAVPVTLCSWEHATHKITPWLPTQRSWKATKKQCGSTTSSSRKENREEGREVGKGTQKLYTKMKHCKMKGQHAFKMQLRCTMVQDRLVHQRGKKRTDRCVLAKQTTSTAMKKYGVLVCFSTLVFSTLIFCTLVLGCMTASRLMTDFQPFTISLYFVSAVLMSCPSVRSISDIWKHTDKQKSPT